MENNNPRLLAKVARYYSEKLAAFGETPQGVDWNGAESQALRFRQLCRVVDTKQSFSLNDLGCGYGALLDYLSARCGEFGYRGFDVSEDMTLAARQRHAQHTSARFSVGSIPDEIADYGIASGIFNVRMDRTDQQWRAYIDDTLGILDRTSRLGFAFNCLTAYSDPERMRDDLFYADPCEMFDHCKRHFAPNVALLHDYGLYEFTVLVKKQL